MSDQVVNTVVKKRVDYLDMLKCLGMFIVVSGHIHQQFGWFSLTIHCFVIPLYFLLSGMTFKRDKYPDLWTFIKHRAKTLLLPYVMFSVITWAFWAVYNLVLHTGVDLWKPLLQTVLAQGSGGFLVHNVPLWFLPCLFVVEVLYYIIDHLPAWANIICCAVLSCIGSYMIMQKGWFILLPWSIDGALTVIIFYCAGNMLTRRFGLQGIQDFVLKNKWVSVLGIIILTCIMVYTSQLNKHVSLGMGTIGRNPALYYANAFMGIISIGLFSILVCSIKRDNKVIKAIMDYHLWFGRNSLYIMLTHVPVKGIIIAIMAIILGKSLMYVSNDYVCLAIIFVLTCAICSVLALYIGKWKKLDEQRVEKWRESRKKQS